MIKEEFRLDNQLCFRLYTASRLLTQAYHPLLSAHGLTSAVGGAVLCEGVTPETVSDLFRMLDDMIAQLKARLEI